MEIKETTFKRIDNLVIGITIIADSEGFRGKYLILNVESGDGCFDDLDKKTHKNHLGINDYQAENALNIISKNELLTFIETVNEIINEPMKNHISYNEHVYIKDGSHTEQKLREFIYNIEDGIVSVVMKKMIFDE